MLIAVTAGKGAPGASTAVWALALTWPRPVLVADCDPAGGDLAAGYLAGRAVLDRGLVSWATATRHATADRAAQMLGEHVVAVPEADHAWLLAGAQHPGQGAALTGAWGRLADALTRGATMRDRDVLVDTGRQGDRTCWPVLRAADRVLLVARPTLRSAHAGIAAVERLRAELGDLQHVEALVTAAGPYPAGEVAAALGVPLGGQLPEDRRAAATLSDGAAEGMRGLSRSPLLRSARTLSHRLITPAAVQAAS